ncbi:MAG: LarC family nickel insertion protein, partial [Promethearchaeota archaeon]
LKAKKFAQNVLDTLILAEAEVHENLPEKVHLHELSSVDTLLDILGVTRILEEIGYFSDECKIYLSVLPLGGGKIKSAHGILPVPAPATTKIIEKSSLLIKMGPVESEITTPTGAALLTNLNIENKEPRMIIRKAVYSTGQKEFDNFLNIMKLYYGEDPLDVKDMNICNFEKYHQKIALLETNVDDVSGEEIGNFINIMENKEILDIHVIQGITKKNRPSYIIKVLCHPKDVSSNIGKIIEELGTLGVRVSIIDRFCVDRVLKESQINIFDKIYEFSYKLSYFETYGEKYIVNVKPEFEDLKKISNNTGVSLKKLKELVITQIVNEIDKNKFVKKFKTKKKK